MDITNRPHRYPKGYHSLWRNNMLSLFIGTTLLSFIAHIIVFKLGVLTKQEFFVFIPILFIPVVNLFLGLILLSMHHCEDNYDPFGL